MCNRAFQKRGKSVTTGENYFRTSVLIDVALHISGGCFFRHRFAERVLSRGFPNLREGKS